ncbi:MAG: endoribonuclease MazF [Candidatus Hydrogenedentes bacterium]|nr:endoribonuclease MazF [Candidatus Hydrogenedentota bacterium]
MVKHTENYSPKAGDIVWIDFDPQSGREQSGRRPALVVSPQAYNAKVGLALLCPVTSRIKGYAFEIPLTHGGPIKGVVLADQVRSLDWRTRRAIFVCEAGPLILQDALAKIVALLESD